MGSVLVVVSLIVVSGQVAVALTKTVTLPVVERSRSRVPKVALVRSRHVLLYVGRPRQTINGLVEVAPLTTTRPRVGLLSPPSP